MTGEGDLMETNPGAAKAVGRIPAGTSLGTRIVLSDNN